MTVKQTLMIVFLIHVKIMEPVWIMSTITHVNVHQDLLEETAVLRVSIVFIFIVTHIGLLQYCVLDFTCLC